MKTYTSAIEKPRLVIYPDDMLDNQRNDFDCLGYFFTCDPRMISPDGETHPIYSIMVDTASEAGSQDEHMQLMKKRIESETDEKVIAIYPIVKYEHGRVVYQLGTKHGFDYSNNGFYIVTDKTQKKLGVEKKEFTRIIEQELEDYTKFCNGEIYGFTLFNKDGDVEDSCSGFYSLEDIRDYLPKEWKKEELEQYIQESA